MARNDEIRRLGGSLSRMAMSEKKGWIKVYRKLQECELWLEDKAFDDRSAWIDLLISAGHRDTQIIFNGHPVKISRGQLLTSVRKLAARWKWGNQKTLDYLRLLEELGMIKKDSDNYRTLITIENYEIYQGEENTDRTLTDTPAERKPTTNKNIKNEKNNNKSIDAMLLIEQSDISLRLKPKVADWVNYKKERREGYKETGLKSLLTQIAKKEAENGTQAVIDVIDLSMSNGWKGIIWDRMDSKPKGKTTTFHQFDMRHNYDFDDMEKRLLQ